MDIGDNETAGEVHDRMMELGAEVVLKSVQAIENGAYELQAQNDELATKAPKIYHETCEIDFTQPTQTVHNFVRGLSPYPAAWTTLDDKQLKILRSEMSKFCQKIFENFKNFGNFLELCQILSK